MNLTSEHSDSYLYKGEVVFSNTVCEIDIWYNPVKQTNEYGYYNCFYPEGKPQIKVEGYRQPGIDEDNIGPIQELVDQLTTQKLIEPYQAWLQPRYTFYNSLPKAPTKTTAMKMWTLKFHLKDDFSKDQLQLALWNGLYHQELDVSKIELKAREHYPAWAFRIVKNGVRTHQVYFTTTWLLKLINDSDGSIKVKRLDQVKKHVAELQEKHKSQKKDKK